MFESVEGMLKWAGLYNLTTRTLGEELVEAGLSTLLIQELVTVSSSFSLIKLALSYSLCLLLHSVHE